MTDTKLRFIDGVEVRFTGSGTGELQGDPHTPPPVLWPNNDTRGFRYALPIGLGARWSGPADSVRHVETLITYEEITRRALDFRGWGRRLVVSEETTSRMASPEAGE